ncbi:MAG: hypothetical protein KME45_32755 [Stenomitos rutilans HA7619-LM2]|jgi:hypothetical protein|nr:hypothetical protein [Stenomitos rutilans HA7619-LM2]
MSDRITQSLTNLTYEVTAIAVDHLAFCRRLHQLNPNLVSDSEVLAAEQRLHRLRAMFKGLQQQKDD